MQLLLHLSPIKGIYSTDHEVRFIGSLLRSIIVVDRCGRAAVKSLVLTEEHDNNETHLARREFVHLSNCLARDSTLLPFDDIHPWPAVSLTITATH